MDFELQSENEQNEKIDKYFDFSREVKKRKLHNMRVMAKPIVPGMLGTVSKGLERAWNGWKSDFSEYCIVEIGQNTQKNPKDLKTLTVTQTPVKDHDLTLV